MLSFYLLNKNGIFRGATNRSLDNVGCGDRLRYSEVCTFLIEKVIVSMLFHKFKEHAQKWSVRKGKVNFLQELLNDDSERHLQFCEEIMSRSNANNGFPLNIIFPDQATFDLN